MPYKDPIKQKESNRIRMQRFRERHKVDQIYLERVKKDNKNFYKNHKAEDNARCKKYHEEHRDAQLIKMQKYNQENKAHHNELKKASNKIRRRTDDNYLIKGRMRCLLYNSLKRYGQGKKFHSSKYGIDFNLICNKLGPCPGKREEWDIDHIIPCASYDLSKVEQVRKCFSPSNLQWMPKIENIKKSNKLIFQ